MKKISNKNRKKKYLSLSIPCLWESAFIAEKSNCTPNVARAYKEGRKPNPTFCVTFCDFALSRGFSRCMLVWNGPDYKSSLLLRRIGLLYPLLGDTRNGRELETWLQLCTSSYWSSSLKGIPSPLVKESNKNLIITELRRYEHVPW